MVSEPSHKFLKKSQNTRKVELKYLKFTEKGVNANDNSQQTRTVILVLLALGVNLRGRLNRELSITYVLSDTLLNHSLHNIWVCMNLVEGIVSLS